MQNLNKFIEQHGSSKGGDFFLGGNYSFAEVAATPFVHRSSAALTALRGYSLEKSIEQQKLTRLSAWMKVITIPTLICALNLGSYSSSYNLVAKEEDGRKTLSAKCELWRGSCVPDMLVNSQL